MNCQLCGKKMQTFDFGYYCDNVECKNYDIEIYSYESLKTHAKKDIATQ